ncbi:hypothetical protein [Deinococcus humi]|uniref:Uncharacterized protein n=1 Tax=Deinococcus humi TaxID=662880 RepID=A0A7W8JXJ1_9DEIO|nr:hypothetical protein [Deinococcus humi]MBB5363489.1 hypothetical protein [Deinococcus humi]GGO30530.1 hypothetical protein GCM10008949_25520 [Deinococcus humi]
MNMNCWAVFVITFVMLPTAQSIPEGTLIAPTITAVPSIEPEGVPGFTLAMVMTAQVPQTRAHLSAKPPITEPSAR